MGGSNFTVMHLNIRSIGNKLDELEVLLEERNVSVACITESWCRSDNVDCVSVPGYVVMASFNRTTMTHGGCLILVKKGLQAACLDALDQVAVEAAFECSGIVISLGGVRTVIICVYRSQIGDFQQFFLGLEESLAYVVSNLKFERIILCGDLNIDNLSQSNKRSTLYDITASFSIFSVFHEATRITPHSATGIDYIFTNFNESIHKKEIVPSALSDHSAQLISYCITSATRTTLIASRSFSQANIGIFNNYLADEAWDDILYAEGDVSQTFSRFLETFMCYFEDSFKLIKKRTCNVERGWLTAGIRVSSRKLRLLADMFSKGLIDACFYKRYKLIYRRVVRQAKRMYFDRKLMNAANKSKTAWKIIKSHVNGDVASTVDYMNISGQQVTDPEQIANSFNQYFANLPLDILSKIPTDLQYEPLPCQTDRTIFLTPVTENEIIGVIRELKNSGSTGDDGIPVSVIKHAADNIAKPLSHIVNLCFIQGVFPDRLKISKIICLHKKGGRRLIESYRPISLLSVFSKIFEKLLARRIVCFLEEHKLLSNFQHGFRKQRSTTTALLQLLNTIFTELDNNKKVMALFLDLSKAFDCVSHEVLIQKAESYGLRGTCSKLLRCYLSDREQYVSFDGRASQRITVNTGVPQGSVLGPLLFLVYCNDLGGHLSVDHCAYADDVTLLSFDRNPDNVASKLSSEIQSANNYFQKNGLALNTKKTFTLQFHPIAAHYIASPLIKLNGESIKQTACFTLLGLHVDMSLNWKTHVEFVCKRVASVCFALKRLSTICSTQVIKMYYHGCFESRLRYGVVFWGNSSEAIRVFRMQKRALRCMLNLGFRETCRPFFVREKILTLPSIYILEVLKLIKKNVQNISTLNKHHEYFTRHGCSLEYPLHRTRLFETNPYYSGLVFYNKIPRHMREANYRTFCAYIKDLLLTNAFYSVQEFMECGL